MTYKGFKNIKFPIYILPSGNWFFSGKVLFLDNLVLDDRSMPGKTLGQRRLQCDRHDLLKLKKSIKDLIGLIKLSHYKYFIDSNGTPFHYSKTLSIPLICYRIRSIDRKNSASLLWVYDIPQPFTLQRPLIGDPFWVRVLHINNLPWLIYDYVAEFKTPSYRRI